MYKHRPGIAFLKGGRFRDDGRDVTTSIDSPGAEVESTCRTLQRQSYNILRKIERDGAHSIHLLMRSARREEIMESDFCFTRISYLKLHENGTSLSKKCDIKTVVCQTMRE